jgi:hypothetical protein
MEHGANGCAKPRKTAAAALCLKSVPPPRVRHQKGRSSATIWHLEPASRAPDRCRSFEPQGQLRQQLQEIYACKRIGPHGPPTGQPRSAEVLARVLCYVLRSSSTTLQRQEKGQGEKGGGEETHLVQPRCPPPPLSRQQGLWRTSAPTTRLVRTARANHLRGELPTTHAPCMGEDPPIQVHLLPSWPMP